MDEIVHERRGHLSIQKSWMGQITRIKPTLVLLYDKYAPLDPDALKGVLGAFDAEGGWSVSEDGTISAQYDGYTTISAPSFFGEQSAQFFMDEQCGQCPPCRMETNQFVHVLKGVQAGKGGAGFAEPIRKVAAFARKKGHCSLIEMAAAPVLSATVAHARR